MLAASPHSWHHLAVFCTSPRAFQNLVASAFVNTFPHAMHKNVQLFLSAPNNDSPRRNQSWNRMILQSSGKGTIGI